MTKGQLILTAIASLPLLVIVGVAAYGVIGNGPFAADQWDFLKTIALGGSVAGGAAALVSHGKNVSR